MSADRTHNELLQKLISGTITDREKWELERASLDDPFLADAIEGFYDQDVNIDDINSITQKIKKQTEGKSNTKTRALIWRRLSIAATLLVLFSASFWIINQTAEHQSLMVENDKDMTSSPSAESRKARDAIIKEEMNMESYDEATEERTDEQKTSVFKKLKTTKQAKQESESQIKTQESSSKKKQEPSPASALPPTTQNKDTDNPTNDGIGNSNIEQSDRSANFQRNDKKRSTGIAAAQKEGADVAENKRAKNTPITKESTSETVEETVLMDEVIASQANDIKPLPQIIQGQITDTDGNPLAGVEIFDVQKNKMTQSDNLGNFNLPSSTGGYVMMALNGYDSTTVAIEPQLSIQLKQSAEILSQRLMRSAEMMDDNQLTNRYKDELNLIFSRNWPLCPRQKSANNTFGRISSTTVIINIDEYGKPFDVTHTSTLDSDCRSRIDALVAEASSNNLFERGRPLTFRFRVNF